MSKDEREYDDDRTYIENRVGRISGSAWYEIIDALDDNREGVRALADRIGDSPNLDRPAAVFIAAIRKGEQRTPPAGVQRLKPRDAFRKFFTERVEYLRDTTDLSEDAVVEAALDYAVSSFSVRAPIVDGSTVKILPHAQGETVLTLEDEMRATLNRPRPSTSDLAERALMLLHWRRIAASLHDKRIAAMHRQLMRQCEIPNEPTHAEGHNARLAMIAEIEALGVAPAPLPGLQPVEGFTTIGEATSQQR